MLLLFCLLIFASVTALCAGFIFRSGHSVLEEKLSGKREKTLDEKISFLDALWDTPPAMRRHSLQTAAITSAVAFVAGMMITFRASVVFAAVFFVISPRLRRAIEINHKKKLFFKQFPRAVSELAAVARTGTLKDGFRVVQSEHPSPVADVFGFIAECIDTGMSTHKAVKMASEQYGYPGLDRLAEAVRIINELGGGEKAHETLTSAADHIRFLERFQGKVDAAVGGIRLEMAISFGIIVLYFLLTSGPWTEGWENVVKHPAVVAFGFLAILAGWYLSEKKINAFKNKSYL